MIQISCKLPLAECHFLRVPPELRAEIFRHLLGPRPKFHLNARNSIFSFEEHHYTAILRANRQIYAEAASLLYSEAMLVMETGDISCLRTQQNFGAPNKKIWRHNPLHYNGKSDADGRPIYDQPEMKGVWNGLMEPHVFSRFENIQIDLDLHFPVWISGAYEVNDHVNIGVKTVNQGNLMKRTHLLKDLATILSRSPSLKSLELTISVEVFAPPSSIQQFKSTICNSVADAFIESDVLYPLELLTNVEKFDLKVIENAASTIHCLDDMYRKLGPKTAKVVEELKRAIERKI